MSLVDDLILHVDKIDLPEKKKILFDSFLKTGFPTTNDEEWKYTSLKKIISNGYRLDYNSQNIDKQIVEKYCLGFGNKIVFSEGKMIHSPNIKGVYINDFSDFECKNADSIAKLNSALANKGFDIHIEDDTVINQPIEILFFSSTENNFSQYRNRITIGKNSSVKIIEGIRDLSDSNVFTINFTQINCAKNSNLEYNKIQNNQAKASLIDYTNIFQEKDSTCNVNTLIFGGNFIRNNLNFEQNGFNCESNMNGVSILSENQFADNHTFVDHKVAHCRSNETYKGIYLDSSKGVFNGKIMVRQDAQKIDAFQSNNNLLLSEKSTIDSKPQLEIYADDVKCSHGCTIGQLDNDALFYMRSRGIGKDEAEAVLTYAFASEVIESITIPELKKLAQELLAKKLNVNIDFSLS